MARLTLEIETRRDPSGLHGHRWIAILGQITGAGATEPEAKADLRATIESRAAHTTPRMVHGPDGSVVLAHPAECNAGSVCTVVLRPGSDHAAGYTMEDLRGRNMTECARDRAGTIG